MFFRPARDGLDLFVRLTPRGGADALEDADVDHLAHQERDQ